MPSTFMLEDGLDLRDKRGRHVGIPGSVSAQPDRISASSGRDEPLAAQWIHMPAPEVRWSLRFEIFTELAPAERLEAEISIIVRSPALVD